MNGTLANILRVFLIVYMLYGYAKFVELFVRSDDSKRRWLRRVYGNHARMVRVFDDVMLILMAVVVVLAISAKADALTFTAGLLVGMTLIQIYFHRFKDPLTREWTPGEPVTPLKMMAYAIQATPAKAWKELAFITVLFAGAMFALIARR